MEPDRVRAGCLRAPGQPFAVGSAPGDGSVLSDDPQNAVPVEADPPDVAQRLTVGLANDAKGSPGVGDPKLPPSSLDYGHGPVGTRRQIVYPAAEQVGAYGLEGATSVPGEPRGGADPQVAGRVLGQNVCHVRGKAVLVGEVADEPVRRGRRSSARRRLSARAVRRGDDDGYDG